ncbi:GNAT family N-acetyltransferase [Magnetospirillum molischianum]|uniref:N-acetyltransferase n=1 Tax=Magnetospirillum molischianum DSM 120 TaxID=1150626 RepID=H8FNY7_MAGML|nr:GNAT family N-acetyltransferase [Magnetospirillum molischianum]CCG40075.1 conserved hypothetical protein; putative Acyl-CoA N-acyltransferase domain [Magnetospirillum molischianum DSM 120]
MSNSDAAPSVTIHTAIAEIPAAAWNACAGSANPFVRHDFLDALEQSGAVAAATGWQPCHLAVRDGDGRVLAVAPLYLKSHSMGEYVFDHAWAEASHRAGRRYYPKLQGAVPFTPVPGPRLLIGSGIAADAARRILAQSMIALTGQVEASSVHVTFAEQDDATALAEAGFLIRLGWQYHWHNNGYDSFDAFLAALSSRRRKAIRKERDAVAASGVTLSTLVGDDIKPHHWDSFHRLYQATCNRKWGEAYLNRSFFECLSGSAVGEQAVLILAVDGGEAVGAAFNMVGDECLFGRNWGGAAVEVPFLHFEACYYRAIDFAISHRLARVEAGAQGEHKIARGYLPTLTRSAHWIAAPDLRRAISRFLDHERAVVERHIAEQCADGPFRCSAPE